VRLHLLFQPLGYVFFFVGGFGSNAAWSALGQTSAVDAFSAEQNPGKGVLEFVTGNREVETIEFGGASGRYAFGLRLKKDSIPAAIPDGALRKNEVIQIGLGTLPSKAQGLLPQFGSLTLLMPSLPSAMLELKVGTPTLTETVAQPTALVLMNSSKTTIPQSDEEKLRNSYFSLSGISALTPKDTGQAVVIQSTLGPLKFRKQWFKFEIDAKLSTPFNPQEALLRGGIEFPVYTSEDRKSDELAMQFLSESFGIDKDIQREIPHLKPSRTVSGRGDTPIPVIRKLKPRRKQATDGM
jgi:hypothetical protein